MRVLIVAAIVLLSACCSWLLAWYSCTSIIPGLRMFDFVCGHNTWLQIFPSFFIFAAVFSALIRAIKNSAAKPDV